MADQPRPTYSYHRENVLPPSSAEHPNAMACPKCNKPVWQTAPACECGCELQNDNLGK
jgi:hypothetical protein